MSTSVDEKYIPTIDQLRKVWMDRTPYTNVPEKIEYELGFDVFIDRLCSDRTASTAPTEPPGSRP